MKKSTLTKIEWIARDAGQNAMFGTFAQMDIEQGGPATHDLAAEFNAAAAADLAGFIDRNRSCAILCDILRHGKDKDTVDFFVDRARRNGIDYKQWDMKAMFKRFADEQVETVLAECPELTPEQVKETHRMYRLNAIDLKDIAGHLKSVGFTIDGLTITATPAPEPSRNPMFNIGVK